MFTLSSIYKDKELIYELKLDMVIEEYEKLLYSSKDEVKNMTKITEIITEPSAIYTNSTFKLKIKVEDPYLLKQNLVTEDGLTLITEDEKELVTEWGI